jgi:hypothetical protein
VPVLLDTHFTSVDQLDDFVMREVLVEIDVLSKASEHVASIVLTDDAAFAVLEDDAVEFRDEDLRHVSLPSKKWAQGVYAQHGLLTPVLVTERVRPSSWVLRSDGCPRERRCRR